MKVRQQHAQAGSATKQAVPFPPQVLRVLNAVRHYETGVPLTLQQFRLLTAPVLIARLVNANRHLLALKVSDWLGLGKVGKVKNS